MSPNPHLRCPNCPNKEERHKPPIHGEGPIPCSIMAIGEGPGKTEDAQRERDGTGHPFIGESGIELTDLYLPLMGLRRENVFVTNVIRCLPRDKNGTDNPALAKCCSDYFLYSEIRRVKPRVIITLGARAGRIIRSDLNLEHDHGIAARVEILQGMPIAHIPLYHPAAGLRQPEYMQTLLDDCTALRSQIQSLARGTLVTYTDSYPSPDYRECTSDLDVYNYCTAHTQGLNPHPHPLMGIDTEYDDFGSRGKNPICLSFSLAPGTGRVIRANNQTALSEFIQFIREGHPHAIFHNWMADVTVLRDMGIHLPVFDDTMMMAYHLGNQPQALKTLAHRLCHMEMREFTDVVNPYWLVKVLEWAEAAIPILKPPPPPKVRGVKATPAPKTGYERLGTNLGRLCSDIVNYYGADVTTFSDHHLTKYARPDYKPPEEPVDPNKRWKDWDGTDEIIPLIGNIPFKSLNLVPWPEVIHYACRDADATLRVEPILERLSRHVMKGQWQ